MEVSDYLSPPPPPLPPPPSHSFLTNPAPLPPPSVMMMTDRVFYESLLQQRPESEMAQEWCLAYGVLPADQAKRLYTTICNRKGVKPVLTSPVKGKATTTTTTTTSASGRKRKVVIEDEIEGDDGGLGRSSQWEKQGVIGV
eukprot:scaffold921_cov190-Ochromonas_danica.AAC.6